MNVVGLCKSFLITHNANFFFVVWESILWLILTPAAPRCVTGFPCKEAKKFPPQPLHSLHLGYVFCVSMFKAFSLNPTLHAQCKASMELLDEFALIKLHTPDDIQWISSPDTAAASFTLLVICLFFTDQVQTAKYNIHIGNSPCTVMLVGSMW